MIVKGLLRTDPSRHKVLKFCRWASKINIADGRLYQGRFGRC
jgi:hypothetical protein